MCIRDRMNSNPSLLEVVRKKDWSPVVLNQTAISTIEERDVHQIVGWRFSQMYQRMTRDNTEAGIYSSLLSHHSSVSLNRTNFSAEIKAMSWTFLATLIIPITTKMLYWRIPQQQYKLYLHTPHLVVKALRDIQQMIKTTQKLHNIILQWIPPCHTRQQTS